MRVAGALVVLAGSYLALAVDTIVDLGYSKYQGRIVGEGTTQWLGMRYAAPPLGKLRFVAPQDPPTTTSIEDASKFGPICLPQNPTDWTTKPSKRFTISEDCLFVNVFAPSNATVDSKLPVMYFIQGGGFNSNSNANYNGSDLARVGNMVVVSVNYRVGPYGFLQSREVKEEGNLNVGMRDVVKGLEWVRHNVAKFGGNASHVVLNGDSAGAMAVVILLTSPKFRNTTMFVGAISESTSQPTLRTLEQGTQQYDCLLRATGCSNSTTSRLSCLRSLNASSLMTTNCWFNPHIDNDLIPLTTIDAFAKGHYRKVPTIFGSCANEGAKNDAPQKVDSISAANDLFLSGAPSLSNSSLQVLDQMYIINKTEPVFPNSGRYWRHVANALGDIRFHCLDKLYQDSILANGGEEIPTWTYNYAVRDPEHERVGYGAYHTVELFAVWGPNNTDGSPPKSYNGTNQAIVPVVQGYWTSFVRYLDPNKARLTGTPEWRRWSGDGDRLMFVTNATSMERMSEEQSRYCRILKPLVKVMEQEPGEGVKTELKWIP